ncbi:hypothetical protein pb186bvf_016533 [Paramecium bursaria]
MNKYTLTFQNEQLEQQFIKFRLQTIQKPMFIIAALMATSYHITKIIQDASYKRVENSYLSVALLIYLIIASGIVHRNEKYIKYFYFLTNLLCCLIQIDKISFTEQQQMFMYGTNVMSFHIVLALISDFKSGSIQMMLTMFIRVSFTAYYCETQDFIGLIGNAGIVMLLSSSFYFIEQSQRKQFLLTLKDRLWIEFLPTLLQKSYIRFSYEDDQLRFNQISSNGINFQENYCQGCNLRYFLREARINKQNLENFLFNKKLRKQYHLEVLFLGQRLIVSLYNFGLDNKEFLMTIYQKIQSFIPEQLQNFCRMEKQYLKKIQSKLVSQNSKLINQTYSLCLSLHQNKVKIIDLTQLITKQFKLRCNKMNLLFSVVQNKEMQIVTFSKHLKCIFNLFLMFSIQSKQQYISFYLEDQQDFIIMIIRLQHHIQFKLLIHNSRILEYQRATIQDSKEIRLSFQMIFSILYIKNFAKQYIKSSLSIFKKQIDILQNVQLLFQNFDKEVDVSPKIQMIYIIKIGQLYINQSYLSKGYFNIVF